MSLSDLRSHGQLLLFLSQQPTPSPASLSVHHYLHHDAVSQGDVIFWHCCICEQQMEATPHAPFTTAFLSDSMIDERSRHACTSRVLLRCASFSSAPSTSLQWLVPGLVTAHLHVDLNSILHAEKNDNNKVCNLMLTVNLKWLLMSTTNWSI